MDEVADLYLGCSKFTLRQGEDYYIIKTKHMIKQIMNQDYRVQVVVSAVDLKEFLLEVMNEYSNKKNAEVEEQYLTAAETAQMLHCTATTLWRWNKSGYLCCAKVGTRRCYKMSDVKRIMEGK